MSNTPPQGRVPAIHCSCRPDFPAAAELVNRRTDDPHNIVNAYRGKECQLVRGPNLELTSTLLSQCDWGLTASRRESVVFPVGRIIPFDLVDKALAVADERRGIASLIHEQRVATDTGLSSFESEVGRSSAHWSSLSGPQEGAEESEGVELHGLLVG